MIASGDIDSYITATAALLDLAVPPESRVEVRVNLLRLAETHTVLAGRLGESTEPRTAGG